VTPLSLKEARKQNAVNGFLIKDFEKYYDIRINRIISPDDNDEIKVYQFTPYSEKIGENSAMISGLLYIRTKDLSIVRMEANVSHAGLEGIPNLISEKYNFIVTYRDGSEAYPIVETVKCDAIIKYLRDSVECNMKLYSVLFATDDQFKSKGKKLKHRDHLLEKIAESEYDQEFWDNNPVIKRTKIEEQVVNDFNRLGYFGSMNLN
jgi:hypothetical protein